MAQHMVCLGECSTSPGEVCALQMLRIVLYKYKLGQLDGIFKFLIDLLIWGGGASGSINS